MKLDGKILIVFLAGAVINGGFYAFQKVSHDKEMAGIFTAWNLFRKQSKSRERKMLPAFLHKITLFADHDSGLRFELPEEIAKSWTEKYHRQFYDQDEIRLASENIVRYLHSIEKEVGQEPVNAKLEFSENKVIAFSLPQDGVAIDIEKSLNQIFQKLKNGETEIEIATKIIKPEISLDAIDNLGITALLARGESDFTGSSNARIHNIATGAEKFNGAILKPGEEFSFNSILGKVDGNEGYKHELVIRRGKLIPEYGGGICQVSTTMFRAAALAGLPILERRAHSLPVRYYHPQGFDATIYPGVVDLKFKNDTTGHILIQTKVEEKKIFIEFYGKPDKRTVEMSGPTQYDVKPSGALKAVLTRTVTMPDGTKNEEKFYSNYKSPSLFPLERSPLE